MSDAPSSQLGTGIHGGFVAARPTGSVDPRERLSHDTVRAVVRRDGRHIGIVAGNVRTDGLEVLPYREHRLVVVATADHPIAIHDTAIFEEPLDYERIGLQDANSFQ